MDNLKRIIGGVAAAMLIATQTLTAVVHWATGLNDPEFNNALSWMHENGLTQYETVDNYRPFATLTREQASKFFAEFAKNTLGETPETTGNCNFDDMDSADQTLMDSMKESCQLGLFNGSNGEFMPKQPLTKAQAVTVLVRALDGEKEENANPWWKNYFQKARELGLTKESDVMALDREVTRYEMGLMLYRSSGESEQSSEDDQGIEDLLGGLLGDGEDTSDEDTTDEDTSDEDTSDEDTSDEDSEQSGETDEDTTSEEDQTDEEQSSGVAGDNVEVTLNPETPSAQDVPASTPRVEFLTFDVAAGSEDVSLDNVEVEARGFGDYENLEDVSIYQESIEVADDSEDFDEDGLETIDFEDEVVKANSVKTYSIVAKINEGDNNGNTYGVSLTDLNASSEVKWLPLNGNTMTSRSAGNLGFLNYPTGESGDEVTEDNMNIGQKDTIASFDLEQGEDGDGGRTQDSKEDVKVYSVKLTESVDNSADLDKALADVTLMVDGEEIVDQPSKITDEELTFDISSKDVVLDSDTSEDKTFEVVATIVGESTETVDLAIEDDSDIYAKGVKNGFNAEIVNLPSNEKISDGGITIQWAPIEVSFDETEADEVTPGKEDFSFGTLNMKATNTDYEISDFTVRVKSNVGSWFDDDEISVGWEDCNLNSTWTGDWEAENKYVCDDIDINAEEENNFDITATIPEKDDVNDGSLTDGFYEIDLDIDEGDSNISIDDGDETYSSNADLDEIFSETNFDSKRVDVEDSSINITTDQVNQKDVTVGQEVLAYKWELSVGDAEDLSIEEIVFAEKSTTTGEFDDIVEDATLRLNDKDFDEDWINSTDEDITFSPKTELNAGEDYDFSLEITVEDDNSYDGETLEFNVDSIDAEDSDGDSVDDNDINYGDNYAILNIHSTPTLDVAMDKEDDNVTNSNLFTEVDKFVRAGSESVVLGRVEYNASNGEVELEDMYFQTTGNVNLNKPYKNIRVTDEDLNTQASADDVTYNSGTGSVISFEDVATTVEESDKKYLYVMGDVKPTHGSDWFDGTSGIESVLEFASTGDWNAKDNSWDDIDVLNVDTSETTKSTTVVYSEVTAPVEMTATDDYSFPTNDYDEAAELSVNMKNDNQDDATNEEYVAKLTGMNLSMNTVAHSGSIGDLNVRLQNDGDTVTWSVDSNWNVSFTWGMIAGQTSDSDAFEIDGDETIDIEVSGFEIDTQSNQSAKITISINDISTDGGIEYTDGTTVFTDTLKKDSEYDDISASVTN